MKRWILCGAGLAVLLAALPQRAAGDDDPAYVGTAICIKCHIDFARRWAALEHSQKMSEPGRPPEKTGCEACHGPGGAHVAGKRSQIRKWEPLELDQRSAVCLNCHEDKVTADLWNAGLHAIVLSCDACHDVHHPTEQDAMLRKGPEATCLECHDTLAKEAEAKHHHPLLEGVLNCSQCHSFHGSAEASLLTQPQDKLCADCHGEEVPKTEAHQREDYRLNHKAEAKADPEQCTVCHSQETFCNTCHIVKVPHAENYALEHTDEAKKRLATCLQCHAEDFCAVCHDPVPKPAAAP